MRHGYKGNIYAINTRTLREILSAYDLDYREGDDVHATFRSSIEPGRRRVVVLKGAEGRAIRKLMAVIDQEDMRARRMRGDFVIPKPPPTARPKLPSHDCEECGDTGWIDLDDERRVECPVCRK